MDMHILLDAMAMVAV